MGVELETLERIGGWGYADPHPLGEDRHTGALDTALAVAEGYAEADPDLGVPFVVLTESGWAYLTRLLEARYRGLKPSVQRRLTDMCLGHVRDSRDGTRPLRLRLRAVLDEMKETDDG